jgi:hypothetical protein
MNFFFGGKVVLGFELWVSCLLDKQPLLEPFSSPPFFKMCFLKWSEGTVFLCHPNESLDLSIFWITPKCISGYIRINHFQESLSIGFIRGSLVNKNLAIHWGWAMYKWRMGNPQFLSCFLHWPLSHTRLY